MKLISNTNWILLGNYRTGKMEFKLCIQLIKGNCDRGLNSKGKIKEVCNWFLPWCRHQIALPNSYTSISQESSIRMQGQAVVCLFENNIRSRATRTGFTERKGGRRFPNNRSQNPQTSTLISELLSKHTGFTKKTAENRKHTAKIYTVHPDHSAQQKKSSILKHADHFIQKSLKRSQQ